MTVAEVMNKISEINDILDQYSRNPNGMSDMQLENAMDFIEEYRDNLMGMKVTK